jgi:hypothetical protein
MELDVGEVEELLPEFVGEDRITIIDDGASHSMEVHNLIEDDAGDRCGSVGVAEGHEMCVLGEEVGDCQND